MKRVLSSKIFQQLLGLSVTIGILAWLIHALEWDKVWEALLSVNFLPLIPAALTLLAHMWIRAWRWKFLLPQVDQGASHKLRYDSIMAGNLASYILPLRAGEFVRPFLITRRSSLSFPTAFVSVVIERFFDLITVLLTFAVLLLYLPDLPSVVYQGAGAFGLLAGAILVVIILGTYLPNLCRKISHSAAELLPDKIATKILKFSDQVLHGLSVLRDPRNLFMVLITTVIVWASCIFLFYLFFLCFPIETSLLSAVSVTIITALAVAAPSAPGFIGVFEAACVAALKPFDISHEMAFSYGLIAHALHYVVLVGYGIYLALSGTFKVSEIQKATEMSADETQSVS